MSGHRYPVTTGLQAWRAALYAQLDAAREQLHPIEYAWLVDLLVERIALESPAMLGVSRRLRDHDDLDRAA